MTAKTKTSVKSFFEDGDQPDESEFIHLIDSYQDASGVLQAIVSAAASSEQTGLLEITATAGVTTRSIGAFGVEIISADSTASATTLFDILAYSTFGKAWVSAATTADAIDLLGVSSAGKSLIEQSTTAGMSNMVAPAATSAQVSARTSAEAFIRPHTINAHPMLPKFWATITTTTTANPTVAAAFNVASVTKGAVGQWQINFGSDLFANTNYCAVALVERGASGGNAVAISLNKDTVTVSGFGIHCENGGSATDGINRINLVGWGI